jgi:ubiquinone/menaquinone biosynthesis C-methylase UbiE
MPKIDAFEKHSAAYDEWFEKNAILYEAEMKAIRLFTPASMVPGLEVGVGTGKFAAPLGIKYGVDPAGKMVAKAAERGITVCRGVAECLPFSDRAFDFVLMTTTICFVDDVMKSLQEVWRVLKPTGYIIAAFVDKTSDLGKQYAARKAHSTFYKDATFYSTAEVLECIKGAHFIKTEVKQVLVPGKPPESILDGFGRGAFIVIKAVKDAMCLTVSTGQGGLC